MTLIFSEYDPYKLITEFNGSGCYTHRLRGPTGEHLRAETWKRVKEVGKGAFGTVWEEVCVETRELRAVKQIHKSQIKTTELLALTKMSQFPQYFVKFFGWFRDEEYVYLAMEYLQCGDLAALLEGVALSENAVKSVTMQLLDGINVMHENDLCHRDLKPQNILIIQWIPLKVKIGDFGITKQVGGGTDLRTIAGSLGYLAPEIMGYLNSETSIYTNAVDIWSLGCVVYMMITKEVPFPEPRQLLDYTTARISFPEKKLKDKGSTATEFIASLIVPLPQHRLTAKEAREHPWVNSEPDMTFWEDHPAVIIPAEVTPILGSKIMQTPDVQQAKTGQDQITVAANGQLESVQNMVKESVETSTTRINGYTIIPGNRRMRVPSVGLWEDVRVYDYGLQPGQVSGYNMGVVTRTYKDFGGTLYSSQNPSSRELFTLNSDKPPSLPVIDIPGCSRARDFIGVIARENNWSNDVKCRILDIVPSLLDEGQRLRITFNTGVSYIHGLAGTDSQTDIDSLTPAIAFVVALPYFGIFETGWDQPLVESLSLFEYGFRRRDERRKNKGQQKILVHQIWFMFFVSEIDIIAIFRSREDEDPNRPQQRDPLQERVCGFQVLIHMVSNILELSQEGCLEFFSYVVSEMGFQVISDIGIGSRPQDGGELLKKIGELVIDIRFLKRVVESQISVLGELKAYYVNILSSITHKKEEIIPALEMIGEVVKDSSNFSKKLDYLLETIESSKKEYETFLNDLREAERDMIQEKRAEEMLLQQRAQQMAQQYSALEIQEQRARRDWSRRITRFMRRPFRP